MLILSLLAANIFIFVYNNLLVYLNSKFPVEASNQFIRIGAVPEPFEISLFIMLSFVLVLGLFLVHLYKNDKTSNSPKYLKIAVFIFLLLTFIANLGAYPMARDAFPQLLREPSPTYLLFFIISMLATGFILIQLQILSPVLKKNRLLLSGVFALTISLIALITLDPRFNIYGHDYSYFFGPVWEIAHGKTIYTQTPSQYGFVSVLLLAFLHKLNILSVLYLPILIWFFYIVQYALFLFIIFRVSRSLPFSFLGLFSLITINYLSPYHLPSMAPQIGPLRWLPLLISVFVLLWHKKIISWPFIFLIALSSLWVLDSGIYLILAYFATLFLLILGKFISLKNFLLSAVFLVLTLIGIFMLINLFHLLLGYQTINPLFIFSKLKQYGSAGFGMLPMDTKTYFWFVPLIYFASVIYFFQNGWQSNRILSGGRSERDPDDAQRGPIPQRASAGMKLLTESDKINNSVLLFSANISLFASIYFVGRSHPHNLFHISIFPLLNAFILIGIIFRSRFNILVYSFLFVLFLALPFYQRQEAITNNLKLKFESYRSDQVFARSWWYGLNNYYQKEIEIINKNLPENNIVILSPDDTYLFYLVNKGNLLYDNSQFTILTKKDLDYSLQEVYKTCPQKIVADCSLFGKCQNNKPFTEIVGFNIQPLLLSNIEKNCRVKYSAELCTDKLCIAENTKQL